jgi:hypothetical protein
VTPSRGGTSGEGGRVDGVDNGRRTRQGRRNIDLKMGRRYVSSRVAEDETEKISMCGGQLHITT